MTNPVTLPIFDDQHLDQAEAALIQQLNNISHTLEVPAQVVWDTIVYPVSSSSIEDFFPEERIFEVAVACVQALHALCLAQMPHEIIWRYIEDNVEFNDFDI